MRGRPVTTTDPQNSRNNVNTEQIEQNNFAHFNRFSILPVESEEDDTDEDTKTLIRELCDVTREPLRVKFPPPELSCTETESDAEMKRRLRNLRGEPSSTNTEPLRLQKCTTVIGDETYDVNFRYKLPTRAIHLPITVSENTYIALVDTGSTVSVVRENLLPAMHRSIYRRGERLPVSVTLSVKQKEPLNLRKYVDLLFHMNERPMLYRFYIVPDLTNDLVLGMDWLSSQRALISTLRRTVFFETDDSVPPVREVVIDGWMLEDLQKPYDPKLNRISCRKFTLLPEMTAARVEFVAEVPDGDYIITPDKSIQMQKLVLLPSCVVSVKKKRGSIFATNAEKERKFFVKSTTLGTLEPLTQDEILGKLDVDQSQTPDPQTPKSKEVVDVTDLKIQVGSNLTPEQKKSMIELITEYRHVFAATTEEMGRTNLVMHTIDTGDSKPIRSQPYRHSLEERREMKRQIEENIAIGVLEPSSSPWSSPVVFAKKKDGTLRLCGDFRKLNAITRKDVYPLPRIDDALDRLSGAKFFSSLDFIMGYHQVAMHPEHKEKTSIITPDGLYQYNVLPFGLCNAPAAFQRLVDKIFQHLKWTSVLIYLDDIVVFARNFEEHQSRLKEVFQSLEKANLTLKPSKCVFGANHLNYLGHIISEDGVAVDPEKTNAAANFPQPKNPTDVRSFLGLAGYYRRFVKNFTKIAAPLTKLTEKSTPFQWEDEQQQAFDELKKRLTSAPVLVYPDENAPTALHTDASGYGMGATLTQIQDGKERVVAYASQKFSSSEKKYSTTDRELLAVFYAVKKFRPYLHGRPFDIITDHHTLCHMLKLQDPSDRICNITMYLQKYDYTIKYKSGKKHTDADSLSRNPVDEPDENEPELSLCSFETTDIATIQREDSHLRPIIEALLTLFDEGEVPDSKIRNLHDYSLQEGVLYKANYNPSGRLWLLCVPASLQIQAIKTVHDDPTGGHLGLARTLATLKGRFFWPSMFRTVRRYVAGCQVCQAFNRRTGPPPGLLQVPDNPTRPFQKIGIDYLGPFPKSHRRNTHVIVMIDHLTRYVEAVPVTAATTKNAIEALKSNIFYRHSIPELIVQDQGRHFTSNTFKDELSKRGIKHSMTSPYHPQTNGLTERFNETLKRCVAKFAAPDQKDWDDHIQAAVYSYNATKHDVTNYSPHYLLYAKDPVIPVDLVFPVIHDRIDDEEPNQLRDRLHIAHSEARGRTKVAKQKEKVRYDSHHVPVQYNLGDLVWRHAIKRKIGLNEKLLPTWDGPYEVVGQLTPVTYWLKDLRPHVKRRRKKPFYVHVLNLKPYVDEIFHVNEMQIESCTEEDDVSSLTVFPPTLPEPRSKKKSTHKSISSSETETEESDSSDSSEDSQAFPHHSSTYANKSRRTKLQGETTTTESNSDSDFRTQPSSKVTRRKTEAEKLIASNLSLVAFQNLPTCRTRSKTGRSRIPTSTSRH